MEGVREEDVVIVGGGIAGLATALALRRVGVGSLVLERSEGIRVTGAAITLGPNAWLALDALGVAHKLTPRYAPFQKVYITDVRTRAIQEANLVGTDRSGPPPRTVHRKALLEALAGELPPDTIRFSSKLSSLQTQSQGSPSPPYQLHLEDGTIIEAKVVIGCDGVNSKVARWLGLSEPVHSGRSAILALSEYPQGHGLKHEVQQFVDVGIRAGLLPISDRTVYWFFTCKSTPKVDEMGRRGPELIQREVLENMARDLPPIYKDVVRHCDLATLTWAPLRLRVPWGVVFGSLSRGGVTVAGDAMHPMTPDLGQGGCSALEDAVILGRHLGQSLIDNHGRLEASQAARALEGYVKERRWRAAGLITGSYISGWAQQAGSGWWHKFVRDVIFYKFLYRFLFSFVSYDCGKLPTKQSV